MRPAPASEPPRPFRVLMVIPSLSAGGAERVLVRVAEALCCRRYEVTAVTVFGPECDFYRLPPEVTRVAMNLGGTTAGAGEKLAANLRRAWALRRVVLRTRPRVIVSFMTEMNVLAVLAAAGLDRPVVVTEHNDPHENVTVAAWRLLRRATYPWAAALVSVSRGVDRSFDWLPSHRRTVIYNPIRLDQIEPQPARPQPFGWKRTVLAIGRLEHQKGFDLLVEAFARIAGRFPHWGLAILGEGTQRKQLEQQIADYNLRRQVVLPGLVANPFPLLKGADLFVLSSRFEGFGIAIAEAMACGLPVIAADCPSGPAEIIRHQTDGLLVPPDDAGRLAEAMAGLMADPAQRTELGARAAEAVRRFDLPRIADQWEMLLHRVARRRPLYHEQARAGFLGQNASD